MAKYPVKYTLRELLGQHGITQKDIEEELQISEDAVRRKMNGMSDWYLRECFVVAKLLGLNIDEVFLQN